MLVMLMRNAAKQSVAVVTSLSQMSFKICQVSSSFKLLNTKL